MWAPAEGRRTVCFVRALAGGLPESHDLPESTWLNGLHPGELRRPLCTAALLSAQSLDSDHTD